MEIRNIKKRFHSTVVLALIWIAVVARAQTTTPATGPSAAVKGPPTKVTFREDGIALVNGRPFFPIGIWVYEINTNVMADLHEHQFNTVIGGGFGADKLDYLYEQGMMAVPISGEEMVAKGKDHPALLAWCLADEPESGHSPEAMRTAYEHLKAKDPNHPLGLDHYLFEALAKYKDACDFSMTDVYPIMRRRDGSITHVGLFVDEARRIHGANWPHWVFIQDFGGPNTEGAKWAQPLPHEVRFMVFNALVHRVQGVHYFSYWNRPPLNMESMQKLEADLKRPEPWVTPVTWAAIGKINRDVLRIVPWLTAKGTEEKVRTESGDLQLRAKKVGSGWMIIALNTTPKFFEAKVVVENLGNAAMRLPYENRAVKVAGGRWKDRFGPYEEHVYLVGEEPEE